MENLNEDVARPEPSPFNPLKALGSFRMKAQRYLIIAPEQIAEAIEMAPKDETIAPVEGNPTLQSQQTPPKVLCQFSLPSQQGHKTLAIIESPTSDIDPTDLLTQREFEIVRLVAKGWANKQIAHVLKISQWTVSTHLRRIFLKLEVDTRAAMVYRCAVFI